ncbi:hypothetical protein PsorP6_011096 [Peronosclerospora sorghi]|uniref:Uncharacterized protein n=1 Tax=Peronosclerospora sorghi TaxID=230839 RepID=A0ACC0VY98_9STRA|nr:hypothetical protein PsorP6_011096 [Peronosclerospora sorghi]
MDITEEGNRLAKKIVWASPNQISLARRFFDVVLNDNAGSRNRFNMALGKFVVIDNVGKKT